MNYYLAIDQGTHASRVILYDDHARLISSQVKDISLFHRDNKHIEHDPLEVLNSVTTALNRLLGSLSADIKSNILSCGIACQRSTVLACNAQGDPISPAISWQDVRGEGYLNELPLSSEQVQQISGLPLSAHYAASKCRWLLDHHPQVLQAANQTVYFTSLSSFLLKHLVKSSPFVIDHSQAQRMQLMDIETLNWSERLAHAYQIPISSLPQCRPVCDDYGLLADTAIPITAVCGDQNAAFFGSGELSGSTALINLGSGAFVLRKLPSLKRSSQLLTGIACSSRPASKGSLSVDYFREATINGAGNALSWFEHSLSASLIENWRVQLPVWLNEIHNPPLFINTVGGLGSPWWSSQIEPHFYYDLNDEPDIAAKSVAIIESIVFLIQDNLHIMMQEHPLEVLKLSGGLSQLDGLCQKLANLSGLPIERLVDKETTARGIAWLSRGEKGIWSALSDQAFEPVEDTGLQARYHQFQQQLSQLLI